jgi:chromosome segregation ATPase
MNEQITKKDLEQVLDKKFSQYQGSIIEAVDFKFQKVEQRMDVFEEMVNLRFQKVEAELAELRADIRRLTNTLDNFLKRLTDHEDEFKILKAEVNQIKSAFKEKFGVEISV